MNNYFPPRMSDFSSFTGKFRARNDALQGPSTAKVTKGKKESFACIQCRRSKIRCDRRKPCGTCIKRGYEHDCTAATNRDASHQMSIESRLVHMESLVKDLISEKNLAPSSNDTTSPAGRCRLDNKVDERSPENDVRYVGSTHWSAILDDIQELKSTLGEHAKVQVAEKLITGEATALSGELIFGASAAYSMNKVISRYLPSKVGADRLLSLYFRGETFIVPFIHTYHFQRQYRQFWTDTESVSPLWLSILFSICCLASHMRAAIHSNDSHQATEFHTAAAQCLIIGEYHRPQPQAVEALAMYAQCKNVLTLDPSRETGRILGMVVRMAYEMGYHRDPDTFGSLTVFEGEMRRRFWASCKQVDVMISFQLGLPSNICLENCDTKPPRNLLDSDFDVESQVLPTSRSEEEATRLLWFIVKDRQMDSFSKVCKDALSFKEKTEAEILKLDEEIRQMHSMVPNVLRTRPLSESITDAPFLIMTRLYVEFLYLKSLCVLHRKYMVRGIDFSVKCCISAGMGLVGQFIDMHNEMSPGGQLHGERWMLTNFTMNDFFLGVMVLCLVLHTNRKRDAHNPAMDRTTEREVLSLVQKSYHICLEKSQASRDACRVSHAARLTLSSAQLVNATTNAPEQQLADNAPATAMESLYFQAEQQGGLENETHFSPLDLINFADNFETIDWSTMFDPQLFGSVAFE